MSVEGSGGQGLDEGGDVRGAVGVNGGKGRLASRRGASVRVLVVDDEPLARAGCRLALEAGVDLVVAGESDCASAVAMAVDRRVDVVVVNGRRPGLDALDVTRWIRADERLGATRVIVFAAAGWDVFEALRARVCGVLSPNAQPDELRRAVGRWRRVERSWPPAWPVR